MAQPTLDPWQYRLQRNAKDPIHIFGSGQPNDWGLEVGPGLPVIRVTDANGASAGVLLGFPIDLGKKKLLDGSWQSPTRLGGSFDAYAKDVIWALGGRFLWIAETPEGQRVYADCSAQVSCVFDCEAGLVGSTAAAVLHADQYTARFNKDAFVRLGVDSEGWFPAGLTAHHGLQRLLPNHYLDLGRLEVHRYWPVTAIGTAADPEDVVTKIIDVVGAQFEALVNSPKRFGLALTGGRETRLLLACARPYLDKIDMVTVVGGDRHEVDSVLARRIAIDHGLQHRTLQRRLATVEQRNLFVRRGGHCNADSNSHYHPSVWPIADTHHLVGGVGGEVARGFFWKSGDDANTDLTANNLIGRFGLAQQTEVSVAVEAWLRGLPPMSAYEILDLAYLEHRDGAWYASQFCCDPTLVRFAPLLTSQVVELMISLPPEWKRQNRLGQAVIARLWPELASYPYNSLGPWRDAVLKVQKVAKSPALLAKKLRKLMS